MVNYRKPGEGRVAKNRIGVGSHGKIVEARGR